MERRSSDCEMICSLDSQLLAVAEGEAVIGERAQHDGRVHHILLEAQQPHIESLKPHQHSILCSTSNSNKMKHSFSLICTVIFLKSENYHI